MKRTNNNGFSMVELIVVIAVMASLTGIIAPRMTSYVEKARESKDLVNVSTAYHEIAAAIASEDKNAVSKVNNSAICQADGTMKIEVPLKQVNDGWSSTFASLSIGEVGYADANWINEPKGEGVCTVYASDGQMYIDWGGEAVALNDSNSIAKYVLNNVQQDLISHLAGNESAYASIFTPAKVNNSLKTTLNLPGGKKVDVVIYNRNYDNYQDVKTRMVKDTASLIYNSSTGKVTTIIFYDGKDYTSWSQTDDQWVDNNYITKK